MALKREGFRHHIRNRLKGAVAPREQGVNRWPRDHRETIWAALRCRPAPALPRSMSASGHTCRRCSASWRAAPRVTGLVAFIYGERAGPCSRSSQHAAALGACSWRRSCSSWCWLWHRSHARLDRADDVLAVLRRDGRLRWRRSSCVYTEPVDRHARSSSRGDLRRHGALRLHHQARPDRAGARSCSWACSASDRRDASSTCSCRARALHLAISVIGVLVFTGLTAYDTQKIKEMYYAGDGAEIGSKKAVMGALVALSRLHQPLPLPAALHRRPPLSNAADHSERTGAIWPRFCFARALAPASRPWLAWRRQQSHGSGDIIHVSAVLVAGFGVDGAARRAGRGRGEIRADAGQHRRRRASRSRPI